jgi:hypothetical protein
MREIKPHLSDGGDQTTWLTVFKKQTRNTAAVATKPVMSEFLRRERERERGGEREERERETFLFLCVSIC